MNIIIAKNGHPVEHLNEEESKWVKENLHLPNAELAQHFGVPTRRIRHLMRRANIERYKVKYWTKEEVEFLKAHYLSLIHI